MKTYTINCAHAAYEEDLKGTLTTGKLADFVVLDNDITVGDPEAIKTTTVVMTVVGGKIRYRDGE